MAKASLRAPKPKPSVTTLEAAQQVDQVLFTATVDGATGGPNPTGTITFKDGATVLAEVIVDGADVTVATLPNSVTATYNGDAKYQPSTSQTLNPPYAPLAARAEGRDNRQESARTEAARR